MHFVLEYCYCHEKDKEGGYLDASKESSKD